MKQRYINTDLVLESEQDLSAVEAILDAQADLLYAQRLHNGLWHLSAEARGSGIRGDPASSPERDLAALLTLLESMSEEHQTLLRACRKFDFDIGWDTSEHRPEGHFTLASSVLSRIAAIGASLSVTIYPSSENDDEDNDEERTTETG